MFSNATRVADQFSHPHEPTGKRTVSKIIQRDKLPEEILALYQKEFNYCAAGSMPFCVPIVYPALRIFYCL